ncbi:hypothetical protein P154DRAFT_472469 [Amniculicola lignicola CBS 123094]|uniref:Uncharacterized protein n=1 Tax=Amniculicola lignicola CBS 123094 TaxID=1392246 RepID=A0A6A5W6X7_9PLEO|nr:hypothetical protein P154DRAFT_472469 [Amniculicola lignicola CBS 123094]
MAVNTTTNRVYFPWSWTIESSDQALHQCPTPSSILGTFAVVNGVVSCLAVIFGHRLVVKKLTCGFFGKRGSRSWIWMWILPVALQLAANACIALLIKKSAGYTSDFKVTDLMLFLVARPRLSWIILGAFAFKSQKGKNGKAKADNDNDNANLYLGSAYPSTHAFMSQFIGEFVLQIMSLYIMGRTAHFATRQGYYKISEESYWDIPQAARMMYSGALYYLVAGSLFLIFAFLFILYSIFSSRIKYFGKASSVGIFLALMVLLVSTWMGSWIFWAGFVQLAGDLYCPPKLMHQGVIWTFFSTVGILVGTGL